MTTGNVKGYDVIFTPPAPRADATFGARSHDEFNRALQSFYEGCQAIHEAHMLKNFSTNQREAWRLEWLQKRIRVVHGGSVFCFVDFATGDVLKAAGWRAPAKHARGNIYDDKNGLGAIGPYGPAYLR